MAYLISQESVYKMTSHYKGRYQYMIDCDNAVDRANAEALRIGVRAWQRIGREAFIRAESFDTQGRPLDFEGNVIIQFNEQEVIREVLDDWNTYLGTGIPGNDVRDITQDTMARFKSYVTSRYPMLPVSAPAQEPEDEFDASGKKKKKPAKVVAAVVAKPPTKEELEFEAVKRSNLENVSPRAIDEIVQTINSYFNLNNQNEEIATALPVPEFTTSHWTQLPVHPPIQNTQIKE